tara:strand:- start:352 stop:681 length:330 start_codon:yes stop_codon:yes gene_type:complete
MIQTINLSDFRTAFHNMGRKDQFSYEGLALIFDYIEEYERDLGKQMELDVIGICCDWAEDTPEAIAEQFNIDLEGIEEDDMMQAVMDYLGDHTTAYEVPSVATIIYNQF